MRTAFVVAAAILGTACLYVPSRSSPAAGPDPVRTTLQLHHMRPSRVVEALRTARPGPHGKGENHGLYPEGITSIAADDAHMALAVEGTEKGIADLKEVVALLDVQPTQVLLEMRVLRSQPRPGGRNTVAVVSAPRVLTLNGANATASIGSDLERTTVSVTPRVNGDGTVTLACRLAVLAEGGSVDRGVNGTQRVRPGVKTLVLCLAEGGGTGHNTGRPVALPDPRKVSGYYLEVIAKPQLPAQEHRHGDR